MEFFLFLPQMRMDLATLSARAQAAESAGFTGVALMDHLAPPMAERHDMIDAMVAATWLAAHTTELTISHLVLCDTFRHPAMLARQVVSLDHASGGRFELGIGWGSVPSEFETFGIGDPTPRVRVDRLRETLEVLDKLFTGEVVHYDGQHHQLTNAQQNPRPLAGRVPIIIGGAGPKTMQLVSGHADWWNCPTHRLDRFDELRESAGGARPSIQQMVAFIPSPEARDEVTSIAERRFGGRSNVLIGDGPELIVELEDLAARGVERFYAWFTDFAAPDTLRAFGNQVIPHFSI